MGNLDGGFWAAILIWTAIAIALTMTAYVLHVRESRRQ